MACYWMQSRSERWDFKSPLLSRRPYEVPWKDVRIKFLSHEVPFTQSLYALNGSVIALVHDAHVYKSKNQATPTPFHQLGMIPHQLPLLPSQHECLGMGLVRSINVEKGTFHVITPVDPKHLSRVNTMIKAVGQGGIETPISLLVQGCSVCFLFIPHLISQALSNEIPYATDLMAEGLGALARKTRHDLIRRRQVD